MSVYDLKVSGKTIELPAPIKQKLELNGLIVIRVYPTEVGIERLPTKKTQ